MRKGCVGPENKAGKSRVVVRSKESTRGLLCARTTTIASTYRLTVLSISTTNAAMRSHDPQASPLAAGRDAPMSRSPEAQARSIRRSNAKSDCRSAPASLSAIRCRTANSGISGPRVGVLTPTAETATLAPTATVIAPRIAEESGERGNKDCIEIGARSVELVASGSASVEFVASGSGSASARGGDDAGGGGGDGERNAYG